MNRSDIVTLPYKIQVEQITYERPFWKSTTFGTVLTLGLIIVGFIYYTQYRKGGK